LRDRITPGAPARKAASTASFTLCGVDLLLLALTAGPRHRRLSRHSHPILCDHSGIAIITFAARKNIGAKGLLLGGSLRQAVWARNRTCLSCVLARQRSGRVDYQRRCGVGPSGNHSNTWRILVYVEDSPNQAPKAAIKSRSSCALWFSVLSELETRPKLHSAKIVGSGGYSSESSARHEDITRCIAHSAGDRPTASDVASNLSIVR
jgi:hypothetical protein